MITLNGVGKSFDGGSSFAVQDLSLTIEDGETVVLLGSSGCGKTTLLRVIAGFEDVSSGLVYLGGEVMDGVPPNMSVRMIVPEPEFTLPTASRISCRRCSISSSKCSVDLLSCGRVGTYGRDYWH